MKRALLTLAALALLAVIAAGCGSESAGTNDGTVSSGGTGAALTHAQAVKFAECMRANGVDGFPDPDASGSLTIDAIANGSSIDTSSTTFEWALATCKELEPPGFTGGKVTPAQRKARLAFARCMRDNGVPDFPDPTPDGPLIDTNRIPSSATSEGMTILNATMPKCSRYSAAAGVTGSK